MNDNSDHSPPSSSSLEVNVNNFPESPKPMAFTVDFGDGKSIDTHRHKALVEKLQKKHRRGQSLSKLEGDPRIAMNHNANKKHPLTGNLPRKASFQSDGYFSSDEKSDRTKSVKPPTKRTELSLPLKTIIPDKMTQSCPSEGHLFNDSTPTPTSEIELKDVSSPELDPSSPYSPPELPQSSPEVKQEFIDGTEFDFDKSDTVSDAGTYTLDADNYTEEQKARMSIDAEFKIEQVSVLKKTEDYIKSLSLINEPKSPKLPNKFTHRSRNSIISKMLSPILSPTQNLSIIQASESEEPSKLLNNECGKTFTRIMFPSSNSRSDVGLEGFVDQGSVISVTSSGAFKCRTEVEPKKLIHLGKSEVHVETYVERAPAKKLTANLINVQSISITAVDDCVPGKVSNLPPPVGGLSPTKIPSPIHAISRPRSRNGTNFDLLSDSSLETESYLQPTQNCINALQQRLSLDGSDPDSDSDVKWVNLNNSPANLLKHRGLHARHNSLDDTKMKISNKLEHFTSKNLQGIDQTYTNRYGVTRGAHKIQNSPNNSPLRRSSSFSTKNHALVKNTNVQKELNSPQLNKNTTIQRSASTANIKPTFLHLRKTSIGSDHQKIDRTQFGDTESSSEEEYDSNKGQKRRDLGNLMNTRYNRAFSLRRGRLDDNPTAKCPNTPEMRRKFQPEHLRAISVDRRPVKNNEIQSRYLLNMVKKSSAPSVAKADVKIVAKVAAAATPNKPEVFSRTDSGRFSMRTPSGGGKPAQAGSGSQKKNTKKEGSGRKSNGRSNSSLSSREKEFQNWKRRKSYDPMKAAAEGKRKEIAKKQNVMTQSCCPEGQDCDSSPSHSSSVHRSQSFHGTAALGQSVSSDDDDDLTLSADEEDFTPPTPSPCELSPARASLRNAWRKDHVLH